MIAPLPLAVSTFVVGQPLFGNQWLALLAAGGAIALLLVFVALLGRWLAATHPAPPPKSIPVASTGNTSPLVPAIPAAAGSDIPPEVIPVIIAAITACLGTGYQVSAIRPVSAPSLEALMQQWSYEGRRQIYSSHKVR